MKTIPCVIKAQYKGDYRIHVTFDDGSEKTIDFRRWLKGPIFEPLKDVKYFQRFFLDGWTIAWPNGADIAPETLYAYPETRNGEAVA
ncbi:MAG: DUF2442 domain-containing protein [Nitrospirota bacterium]